MPAFFDDDFLTRTRVQLDRGLVAHRARGHKDRGFLFEYLRGPFLQAIDCRVFAVDVVADFGFRHGATHLRRRLRYRVTA